MALHCCCHLYSAIGLRDEARECNPPRALCHNFLESLIFTPNPSIRSGYGLFEAEGTLSLLALALLFPSSR